MRIITPCIFKVHLYILGSCIIHYLGIANMLMMELRMGLTSSCNHDNTYKTVSRSFTCVWAWYRTTTKILAETY